MRGIAALSLFSTGLLSLSVLPTLAATAGVKDDFQTQLRPFLEQNCLSCHDAETKKGGLDLERFELKAVEDKLMVKLPGR